jgi:hypothetical protein
MNRQILEQTVFDSLPESQRYKYESGMLVVIISNSFGYCHMPFQLLSDEALRALLPKDHITGSD